MKKTFAAVLHIKTKEPQKVYQLAGKVYTNMIANQSTFNNPDPSLSELSTQNGKLDAALKAKDGSKQKNQAIEDQTGVVFSCLKNLASYVTKVAKGDKATILLSGFDCDNEHESHDIPGKVVIKRVEDGSIACSAKIYIEAIDDADRYKVEITSTPTDASSWKTVLDPVSSVKLEITGLTRGQEISIRVTGGNRRGWGTPSEPASFIPR